MVGEMSARRVPLKMSKKSIGGKKKWESPGQGGGGDSGVSTGQSERHHRKGKNWGDALRRGGGEEGVPEIGDKDRGQREQEVSLDATSARKMRKPWGDC